MQNLKQMEDYKKERIAKSSPKEETDDLDLVSPDGLEDDSEVEDQPSFSQEVPGQIEVEPNAPRPYMVIANLKKLCDQTNQLIGMVQKSGKIDQWAVDHVTTSADDIEEVYNYFKYRE